MPMPTDSALDPAGKDAGPADVDVADAPGTTGAAGGDRADGTSHPEAPERPRALGDGEPPHDDDVDDDPGGGGGGGGEPRRRLSFGQVLVLGAALAFLVGAAGYFVGVRTASPPTSAVDEGFLQDMTSHHDQAVEMALLGAQKASDPVVRKFATEVIMFQRRELGLFQAYLQERGVQPYEYDLDRTTMAWMDMPRPLSAMNGMATPEQIQALEDATGTEFDVLFLELMQAHHLGGVHMAEYAAANAADAKIRTMADRMARNQTAEVNEYQIELDRLRG